MDPTSTSPDLDQQSLVEDEDPGDLREVRGLGLFISSPKLNLSRAVGKRAEVSPPRKTPPISSVNSSIYETIIAKASPLLKAAADQKRESEEALSDTVEAPIAINSQTAAPPTPELARERQGDMAEAVTPSEEQIPNEELRVKYGQLLAEKEWLQMQHEELLKKMDLLEQDYLKQREELEDYPQKLSEAEDLCRRRQQEVAFLAETANIFHQALNTIREELEELKCRNVQIERTKKGFEKEATDAKNAQTECQGMCRAKEEEIANLTKKLEEYRLRSEESETKLQATKEEYKRTLEEMRECRNWIDKARSEQIQRDEDQIRFCDRRLMELLSKRHAFQHLSTSPFVQHQALADFLASPLATLPSSFHSLANSPRSATFRHLPPRNTNSTASIRSNWPRSPASSRQSWQSSQRGASSHAGASTVSNPEPLEWITPDYGDASPGPSRLSLEIADLQKRINLSGLVLSRPLSDQYYAQLSLDSPSRPEPLRIQGILDRGQEEETIRDGALGKVEDEPQYSPSENATRESREGSTQVPVEANPQPQAGQGADVQPHQLKSSGSEISIVGQGLELLEETSPLHKGRPVSETAGPSITLSPSSHHVDLDNDAGSALADTAQSENQRRRTSISERSRGTAGNLAPIKTKPNAFQSSSTRGPPPRSSIPPSDVVGEDRLTSPSRSPHSEKAQDSAATSSAVECHQTPGLRQRRSISPQHQSVEPLHNPLSVEERLRMRSTSRSPPDVKVGRWIMMVGDDSPGGSTLGGSTLIGSDYSDQMKDYSRLDPIGGAWIAALGSGSPSPTSTRQVTEIHLFPNLSNSTENVAGVANDLQSRGTRESGTFLSSCRRASAQAAETQTNFVSESTTDSIISKGIKILKQLPIYERRTESISSESSKAVTTPSISPVMSFTDILDGLEQVSDDDGSQIRDSASESGPEPTERELEFEDDPVMTGKTSRGAGKEIQFTWGAAAIVSTTWQEEEASPTAEREGDARAQYESRPSCTPTFYCTSSSLSGYVDRSPQQLLLLIFVAYVALALFVLGRGPLASTLNVGTCSTNSHTTRIPWCALRDRQTRDCTCTTVLTQFQPRLIVPTSMGKSAVPLPCKLEHDEQPQINHPRSFSPWAASATTSMLEVEEAEGTVTCKPEARLASGPPQSKSEPQPEPAPTSKSMVVAPSQSKRQQSLFQLFMSYCASFLPRWKADVANHSTHVHTQTSYYTEAGDAGNDPTCASDLEAKSRCENAVSQRRSSLKESSSSPCSSSKPVSSEIHPPAASSEPEDVESNTDNSPTSKRGHQPTHSHPRNKNVAQQRWYSSGYEPGGPCYWGFSPGIQRQLDIIKFDLANWLQMWAAT